VGMLIRSPVFEVGKVYTSSKIAGTLVTYTLTTENTGSITGTQVVLEDVLPANLVYEDSDGAFGSGKVTWTLAELTPTASIETWFSAQVSCTAGLTVTNDQYRVTASEQLVDGLDGPPVGFTILAPSIIVSATQSAATVIEDQTVYFTGTASTNGTALSYAWDFGDGGTASGLDASHAYTQTGAYTATLTATDSCGFKQFVALHVQVNPAYVCTALDGVSFSYSPAQPVINDMLVFTATITPLSASTPISYTWDFGDGITSTLGAVVQHSFTSVMTYTVQVTAENACTPGGTSDSQQVAVLPYAVYLPLVDK